MKTNSFKSQPFHRQICPPPKKGIFFFFAVAKLPVLQSVRQSAVPWNTRVQTSELWGGGGGGGGLRKKKRRVFTRDNPGINNGNWKQQQYSPPELSYTGVIADSAQYISTESTFEEIFYSVPPRSEQTGVLIIRYFDLLWLSFSYCSFSFWNADSIRKREWMWVCFSFL